MTKPIVIVPAAPPEPAGDGAAFAAGVAVATAANAAEDAAAAEAAAEDAASTADLALDIAVTSVSRGELDELRTRVELLETTPATVVVEEFPMSPEPITPEPAKASEDQGDDTEKKTEPEKKRYGRDSWFGG